MSPSATGPGKGVRQIEAIRRNTWIYTRGLVLTGTIASCSSKRHMAADGVRVRGCLGQHCYDYTHKIDRPATRKVRRRCSPVFSESTIPIFAPPRTGMPTRISLMQRQRHSVKERTGQVLRYRTINNARKIPPRKERLKSLNWSHRDLAGHCPLRQYLLQGCSCIFPWPKTLDLETSRFAILEMLRSLQPVVISRHTAYLSTGQGLQKAVRLEQTIEMR